MILNIKSHTFTVVTPAERQKILIAGALAWCAVIVATPLMAATGPGEAVAGFFYHLFSRICHQFASRSFFTGNHPFPVCARCTGIYFGFLAGAGAYLLAGRGLRAPAHRLWILAAAPMAADVLLGFTGIWEGTLLWRASTGLLFGIAAGVILMGVVPDLPPVAFGGRRTRKERNDAAET